MIDVVKVNPCADCGIKGLYENCKDKCVQYRKWCQYQQGRADAIAEIKPILAGLEGSIYWYDRVCQKLEKLKEQRDG